MNNYKLNVKSESGFTAIELVTAVAVLGVVAYLVLPLVFPSDAASNQEKIVKDLTQISNILEERERIAQLNNSMGSLQVGNPGVFAANSRVAYDVEIDTIAQELRYCLTGVIGSDVYYLDSVSLSVNPTPLGFCLGDEVPAGDGTPEAEVDASPELTDPPAGGESQPVPSDP